MATTGRKRLTAGLTGAIAMAAAWAAFAELDLDLELFNAATSSAVISGINSKDAICLTLTGTTDKTESHSTAIAELRAAGASHGTQAGVTKQLATTLGRLLKLKNKSQYQSADVACSDATKAIERAQKLLDGASEIGAG